MLILSACGTVDSSAPLISSVIITQTSTQIIRQLATRSLTVTPSPTIIPTSTPFIGTIPTLQPTLTNTPVPTSNNQLRSSTLEHVVNQGESLTVIATQYGITVDAILRENNLTRSQVIVPNQRLLIPITLPTLTPSPTVDLSERGALAQQIILTDQPIRQANTINALNYSAFINLSDNVVTNIQAIYAEGQRLGRNPHAFTRIGDSTIEPPHFFYRFDDDDYNLANYAYLQRTIDYYAGSFSHDSVAVIRGLHTWSVFDPMWSPSICEAGEHLLACEFRLYNPSIMIVRLGTNDNAQADLSRQYYQQIVSYSIENGVIPILGTKADRFDGEDNAINTIIRDIATEYDVPLWDFDLVASTLSDNGLGRDNIHLSFFYEHDWRLEAGFETGHGLHNLTGLIVLDEILQVLQDE
ncbi:MAG: LysM peptidoglycan-binding domain-containing protein [Phototrophicaceae bacterium]